MVIFRNWWMKKVLTTFVHNKRGGPFVDYLEENLKFFFEHGILNNDDYRYNFVLNGHESLLDIPKSDNISVIKRDNIGHDFAAYRASLDSVELDDYDYFIFLNDTVRGPFIPNYIPSNITWVDMFLSGIDDKVKLVGPTQNYCLGSRHIQSMCFGMDKIAVKLLLEKGIFSVNEKYFNPNLKWSRDKKIKYVREHEIRMSKSLLWHNYEIKPLQMGIKHGHRMLHKPGGYFGDSPHPLEVMFVKSIKCRTKTIENFTKWSYEK